MIIIRMYLEWVGKFTNQIKENRRSYKTFTQWLEGDGRVPG